jgi:plastocyanin
VRFTGTPGAPARLRTGSDGFCSSAHPEGVASEALLVGEAGALRNAFVWVRSGLERYDYPVPAEPVVLDQRGCVYVPHVLALRAGQPLRVLNSDRTLHNVRAETEVNRSFGIGMPGGQERTRTFTEPEVMVRVQCDVHPWMSAWIGVTDHPFGAVTGDDGAFSLEGLPAGDYILEAWHETLGRQERRVTLADGATATLDLVFGPLG